jgi:beta-galactosidase
VARQERGYFWYRTTFRPAARKQVALLRVGKAQFGTAVWLNGRSLGEYLGCFTAGDFNLTEAMNWTGENVLLVRIGAHPGVLPESAPSGTDQEKNSWTPGIYDSVGLMLSDNPVIESIQIAPRLESSDILIETRIKNYGPARSFTFTHRLPGGGATRPEKLRLEQGGAVTRTATSPACSTSST